MCVYRDRSWLFWPPSTTTFATSWTRAGKSTARLSVTFSIDCTCSRRTPSSSSSSSSGLSRKLTHRAHR